MQEIRRFWKTSKKTFLFIEQAPEDIISVALTPLYMIDTS